MVGHEVRRQTELLTEVVRRGVPVRERFGDQEPMRIAEGGVQPRLSGYSLANH